MDKFWDYVKPDWKQNFPIDHYTDCIALQEQDMLVKY